MRILLDTNIFIYREDPCCVPKNLQSLLRNLNKHNIAVLIHPLSIDELKGDPHKERREVVLSKIGSYPQLENPPQLNQDLPFFKSVGEPVKRNDLVDCSILYAIHRDAADFLVTEDKGIHKRAQRISMEQRVFTIDNALEYFETLFIERKPTSPPALKEVFVHELDFSDSFFDSLKHDYGSGFSTWWSKISRKGRKAWVYFSGKRIGALLICKLENADEKILSSPSLPQKARVKICTLKVTSLRLKIGELFIRMAVDFARENEREEVYLTVFSEKQPELVGLVEEFGFSWASRKEQNEDIFIKHLIPNNTNHSPVILAKKYYPSFWEGPDIKKFIIPIQPQYHSRIFTEAPSRQTTLLEHGGTFIIPGNAIKKAYLSHSRITKLRPGSLLLFYRSHDQKEITSLGVVEKVFLNQRNKDQILRNVGKRTLYTPDEIEEMAKKPTLVILFTHHFHLKKPVSLDFLKRKEILKGAPQSIAEITHEKYLLVKARGEIDERFAIH